MFNTSVWNLDHYKNSVEFININSNMGEHSFRKKGCYSTASSKVTVQRFNSFKPILSLNRFPEVEVAKRDC